MNRSPIRSQNRSQNRSQKTIIGLSVCMALQMTSFVTILPLFARRFEEFGAGVEALGVSDMVYALAGTLAAPFMGALADRLGRRPLILVSLAVNAAALGGYLAAPSTAAITLVRALAGVSTAGLIPAVTGLASDLAPANRQAQWIGFMNAGSSIGWVAGPIVGGIFYDRWGYAAAVFLAIIMAVLTLLAAYLFVYEPDRQATRPQPAAALPFIRRGAFDLKNSMRRWRSTLPAALPLFLVQLFVFFAVLFAWGFIQPRFMFYVYDDLGWSSSMLGLAMGAYGAAMAAGELTCGRSSDRLGRKPVILVGLVLFSAQFFGLAFSRETALVIASFVVAGLGNALYDPALSASILDISPAEHKSRILGIKGMVGSLGSILGPAGVALVTAAASAQGIFLMAAGVAFVAALAIMGSSTRIKLASSVLAPNKNTILQG